MSKPPKAPKPVLGDYAAARQTVKDNAERLGLIVTAQNIAGLGSIRRSSPTRTIEQYMLNNGKELKHKPAPKTAKANKPAKVVLGDWEEAKASVKANVDRLGVVFSIQDRAALAKIRRSGAKTVEQFLLNNGKELKLKLSPNAAKANKAAKAAKTRKIHKNIKNARKSPRKSHFNVAPLRGGPVPNYTRNTKRPKSL